MVGADCGEVEEVEGVGLGYGWKGGAELKSTMERSRWEVTAICTYVGRTIAENILCCFQFLTSQTQSQYNHYTIKMRFKVLCCEQEASWKAVEKYSSISDSIVSSELLST